MGSNADTDLGQLALERLLNLLGVRAHRVGRQTGFSWVLWGAVQRAWSEPAITRYVDPIWILRLRTHALEGFSGSSAQSMVLSAPLTLPTLAGLAQSADHPERLELATNLEVQRGNIGSVPQMLAVAARVQAAEARTLSELKGLAWVGLRPAVNIDAKTPSKLVLKPSEVFFDGLEFEPVNDAWPVAEIAECIDVLRLRTGAEVVRTATGMTATLLLNSAKRPRSILDIKVDATHPLLGRGLALTLRAADLTGPLNAIVTNSLEVGPHGAGDALGGWWATHGGMLRYTGFYPDAFYRRGLTLRLLLEYARRGHQALFR